jgi:hypothetical protein
MSRTIDSLREQVEQRRLQAEMADLERVLRAADLESRSLLEAEWGDIVDRKEYLYDTPGFGYGLRDGRISRPDDRARGACRPFFENEMDLASIRGIGRFLGTAMDTGVGILENLTNYTIGSGFTYEAQGMEGAADDLVATVQSCVDAFTDQLAEREAFMRARRDGEWFCWVHEFGGEPIADCIQPENVTEPRDTRSLEEFIGEYGLDWFLGIASLPNRPARVIGYFVSWFGSASDWDYVPASEMLHFKVNVDTGVKRGLSDFYSVYLTLERAAKLLGNTLQGAAIQAAIAYIRKHATGTSGGQITAFANSKSDYSFQQPKVGGGTKTVRQHKFDPGTIIDIPNGMDYVAGPTGQSNAPIYIQAIQAAFRVAGARWAMPEYMISGDASNANYASTLVAGGPFDRATQARQDPQVRMFTKAHWMALDIRCKRGRFAKWGIWTLAQLQEVIRLNVTPPTVAVQDAKSAEDIRKLRKDAGILSARTWAAQVDLDYDAEVASGAKAVEPMGGMPALPPPPELTDDPPEEDTANPVADSETALNGAQINAAKDVLLDLTAGRTPPEVARGLLLAVGIDEAMVDEMVAAAQQQPGSMAEWTFDEVGNLVECGGEGSGKPGPCPTGHATKPVGKKKALSASDGNAVRDYTTDKFQAVNGALRKGEAMTPDVAKTVKGIDAYLAESPKYEGSVYRKFTADESLIASLQPGATFSDKAFMSTSKDVPRFVPEGSVALKIIGSNGVDISGLSPHGAAEKEVLFPRNSKFKVEKVIPSPQGGTIALLRQMESIQYAEEVSPREAAITAALESVKTTEEAKAILSESYP